MAKSKTAAEREAIEARKIEARNRKNAEYDRYLARDNQALDGYCRNRLDGGRIIRKPLGD